MINYACFGSRRGLTAREGTVTHWPFYSRCFLAQKSAEVRTGTISKSIRSFQLLTQVFNNSGCSVSMIWKQRVPVESTQLVVGNALGQHSTAKPDTFSDGPSIAVFEAFDDHKEHDPECTPPRSTIGTPPARNERNRSTGRRRDHQP